MLRTLILAAAVIMNLSLVFGQTNNYEYLANRWSEGGFDKDSTIVNGGIRRGGWDQLTLNSDSTVIYAGAFSCGFGATEKGTWQLDEHNNTITFLFNKIEGGNSPDLEKSEYKTVATYRIKKLTKTELVLLNLDRAPAEQIAFYSNY